jgi:integrase
MTFPANNQRSPPHIFSESDVAHLLSAAKLIEPSERFPLQPETFRLAILLLYTVGLRRGELLRLRLSDYDQDEETLLIRETKCHKDRIVPLSSSVAVELEVFLKLRIENHLSMDVNSTILWHQYKCINGAGAAATVLSNAWAALCNALGVFTKTGSPPATRNLRRSFAINILQRWYQSGENVQAKLPLLSAFMGHGSVDSTAYL